jgi:zinc/manganese transport system substrate-binding protein
MAMRKLAAALLISLLPTLPLNSGSGVKILVTFSNLAYDVKLISCPTDEVDYLVPPGLDPHEYELRPGDMEKLREADLIVSTAHAPFEASIKGMISRGELKARLLEIPWIEGMNILRNPMTGGPNYHMPILDPSNYIKFMRALRDSLKEMNPSCGDQYDEKFEEIRRKVDELLKAPKLNLTALASDPRAQYYVEWLGIDVKYLLVKEEETPITPSELAEIYNKARNKEIDLIIVVGDENTASNRKAMEISEEFGIRVLKVPSPTEQGSVLDKLNAVISSLGEVEVAREGAHRTYVYTYIIAASLLALAILVLAYLRKVKQ